MPRSIIGTRIRQRRRALEMTQVDLARLSGMSPSYLNMIELNKRPIAGARLQRIAEALGVGPTDLDDARERQLLETLREIGEHPLLRSLSVESDRLGELIGRFPGWARAAASLARAERDATARARVLSDRIANDPYLSETLHTILDRIAAIRSSAEILVDYDDLAADRRERFTRVIWDESRALSQAGASLADYLDSTAKVGGEAALLDEVEAMYRARRNRFEEIDEAAREIASNALVTYPVSRRSWAEAAVRRGLLDLIETVVADESQIHDPAAAERARTALRAYAIAAVLMPIDHFTERAIRVGFDIEALAEAFSVEVPDVCRRLTALPERSGIPQFAYLRANAAGGIVETIGIEGLPIPRFGSGCSLWVLYRAQQSPGAFLWQRVELPSGSRFMFLARARPSGTGGFDAARTYVTDMVAIREEDTDGTAYAPNPAVRIEPVGPTCRLCPRVTCTERVENPYLDPGAP